MNMIIKSLLLSVFFLPILCLSQWETDEIKTIDQVGSHHGRWGFLTMKEGVDPNCQNQHLYFDVSTDLGKSFLSLLQTAKITKQKIRIGYSIATPPDPCFLWMAALITESNDHSHHEPCISKNGICL